MTLNIAVDKTGKSGSPLYRQIADSIIRSIEEGALPSGSRLPTVRELAEKLSMTRVTVHNAYTELKSKGWIDATVGRGTFVVGRPSTPLEIVENLSAPITRDKVKTKCWWNAPPTWGSWVSWSLAPWSPSECLWTTKARASMSWKGFWSGNGRASSTRFPASRIPPGYACPRIAAYSCYRWLPSTGSFSSKTTSTVLKEKLLSMFRVRELCAPPFLQRALAEFLRRGLFRRHLKQVLPVYRKRRDALLQALEQAMPEEVVWTVPRGGDCCWVSLPVKGDFSELYRAALSRGVAYTPGEVFLTSPEARRHFRLCFGTQEEKAIREAVFVLGDVIKDITSRQPAHPIHSFEPKTIV